MLFTSSSNSPPDLCRDAYSGTWTGPACSTVLRSSRPNCLFNLYRIMRLDFEDLAEASFFAQHRKCTH